MFVMVENFRCSSLSRTLDFGGIAYTLLPAAIPPLSLLIKVGFLLPIAPIGFPVKDRSGNTTESQIKAGKLQYKSSSKNGNLFMYSGSLATLSDQCMSPTSSSPARRRSCLSSTPKTLVPSGVLHGVSFVAECLLYLMAVSFSCAALLLVFETVLHGACVHSCCEK